MSQFRSTIESLPAFDVLGYTAVVESGGALGREFDRETGLHIDVFPPSFVSDAYATQFLTPVRPAGQR